MRKIRIAQIGMNVHSHGLQVFETLKARPDLFDIVGYTLVENEREECPEKRLRVFDGYPELSLEEILNDPTIEAVTVETDEIHLTKYAQLAIDHGKHIHMEKPGSPSLADFERLVESARATERIFHVGYMYRYNPLIAELLRDVREGKLGEIYGVEAQMNCYHPKATREWLATLPGGMMFYLGCHLVDLVLLMQGVPTRILPSNKHTLTDGVDSADHSMAVLEYPHGTSFVKTTAVEWGGFQRRQLVVSGSKGTVELKPLEIVVPGEGSLITTEEQRYGTSDTWHTLGEHRSCGPIGRYEEMLSAFAEMVRGERKNPYTYDYELLLFRTLLRCCEENA